jgi:hypothetical protein
MYNNSNFHIHDKKKLAQTCLIQVRFNVGLQCKRLYNTDYIFSGSLTNPCNKLVGSE